MDQTAFASVSAWGRHLGTEPHCRGAWSHAAVGIQAGRARQRLRPWSRARPRTGASLVTATATRGRGRHVRAQPVAGVDATNKDTADAARLPRLSMRRVITLFAVTAATLMSGSYLLLARRLALSAAPVWERIMMLSCCVLLPEYGPKGLTTLVVARAALEKYRPSVLTQLSQGGLRAHAQDTAGSRNAANAALRDDLLQTPASTPASASSTSRNRRRNVALNDDCGNGSGSGMSSDVYTVEEWMSSMRERFQNEVAKAEGVLSDFAKPILTTGEQIQRMTTGTELTLRKNLLWAALVVTASLAGYLVLALGGNCGVGATLVVGSLLFEYATLSSHRHETLVAINDVRIACCTLGLIATTCASLGVAAVASSYLVLIVCTALVMSRRIGRGA